MTNKLQIGHSHTSQMSAANPHAFLIIHANAKGFSSLSAERRENPRELEECCVTHAYLAVLIDRT